MSKKELNNFIYEDEYLRYESYLKGFSKEKFDEFDAISEKVGLDSKIKDLMNSKIVNETENQAAWHPKYKKRKPNINNHLTKLIDKVSKNKKSKKINTK